jgi:uncharacterized OsmC-like protein
MSAFTLTAPIRLVPGSKTLDREATLEPNGDIIRMGVHGPIAEHYKSSPMEPLPSVLDYMVASIGSCLTGTFGGSLLRARVPVVPAEAITAVAMGFVDSNDDGILVLHKVQVNYTLRIDDEHRAAAEEVHAVHAMRCPSARSVSPSIEIVTELEIVSPVVA